MSRIKRVGVVMLVVLALMLAGVVGVLGADIGSLYVRFVNVLIDNSMTVVNDLGVGDDLAVSGLATVGETLAVTGATTLTGGVTGALAATGAIDTAAGLTGSTFFGMDPRTAITVTDDMAIVPTGTYQQLASDGNVGATITSTCTANQFVVFANTTATTITITDTTTTMLSGNAALGQYDTLVVLCDGTNWLQISKSDN